MANETWVPIPSYPNYMVSNLGRVKRPECHVAVHGQKSRRLPYLIVKPSIHSRTGVATVYLKCDYSNKHMRVVLPCLVAAAFLPNPKRRKKAHTIDGNELNCCVDNLKWGHRECKETGRPETR